MGSYCVKQCECRFPVIHVFILHFIMILNSSRIRMVIRPSNIISAAALGLVVLSVMSVSSCRKLVQPTAPPVVDTVVVHPDTTVHGKDTTVHIPDTTIHPGGPLSAAPVSAGVLGVKAIASLGNAGDFEVDLFVADADGKPVLNLPPGALSMLGGLDTLFTPGNLVAATSAVCGPFSAELLLDQSNSMATNDPLNLRLKAAKIFLDGISLLGGGKDEVQVSQFYDIYEGGLQTFGPFTTNGDSFDPAVDNLAGNLGPGTPLYDAMYYMVDSLVQQSHNLNKVLIVFTDGEDNESQFGLWDAINYAKYNNVKVFAIALKTGINLPLISTALSTGGSVMHADDASQLSSYFGSLSKQVHGGESYYKTTWHVKVPNAYTLSGQTVTGTMKIAIAGNKTVNAPFAVTFP